MAPNMALKIELDEETAGNILSDLDTLAETMWKLSEDALDTNPALAEHRRARYHAICDRRKTLCEAVNVARGY